MDVLGGTHFGNELAWWENTDSDTFAKHLIDGNFKWSQSVYAVDLDGDGDIDVLGASKLDSDIAWWENDGSENFTKKIIDGFFSSVNSIYATDVDRDGDVDVLGAGSSTIAWWENKLLMNPNPIAPNIFVSPDTLFFYVGPDEQQNKIEFVCSIKNMGNATLYIENISSETNWITDIDTLNFLVKQGEGQQVTIKCSAEGLFNGIYEGILEIYSNDPDKPIFNLPLVLEMRKGLDVNFVNELEPNNNASQAQRLFGPSPSGIKGTISVSDVGEKIIQNDDFEDLYVFTTGSNRIKLKLYDISADLDLILMKIVGNTTTIWGSNHRGSAVDEEFEKTDLEPGTYYVGVAIYDSNPIKDSSSYSLAVVGDIITGVQKYDTAIPQNFSLSQNYPNPFNPSTTIRFDVPKYSKVDIKIYDVLGHEVKTLINNNFQPGSYFIVWHGKDNQERNLVSGTYFVRLQADDFIATKKIILLKQYQNKKI